MTVYMSSRGSRGGGLGMRVLSVFLLTGDGLDRDSAEAGAWMDVLLFIVCSCVSSFVYYNLQSMSNIS